MSALLQQSLPEFDYARKSLRQRLNAQKQDTSNAITRHFTKLNLAKSGALAKTVAKADQKLFEEGEIAEEGIRAQEAAEIRRLKEVEDERGFKRALFDEDLNFKKLTSDRDFGLALKTFDEGKRQFNEQMNLEKDIAAFNKEVARAEMNKNTSLLGSLFGLNNTDSIFNIGLKGLTGGTFGGIPALGAPSGSVGGSIFGGALGGGGGAAMGGIIPGLRGKLCHVAGVKVVMNNMSIRNIEDLQPGNVVLGGGEVLEVFERQTSEDLYSYYGETSTASHIILEGNVFKTVQGSVFAQRLKERKHSTTVYPIVTENGFYITEAGVVSTDESKLPNAETEREQLLVLNQDKKLIEEAVHFLLQYHKYCLRKAS